MLLNEYYVQDRHAQLLREAAQFRLARQAQGDQSGQMLDPITVNRLGQIRQHEIAASAAHHQADTLPGKTVSEVMLAALERLRISRRLTMRSPSGAAIQSIECSCGCPA